MPANFMILIEETALLKIINYPLACMLLIVLLECIIVDYSIRVN